VTNNAAAGLMRFSRLLLFWASRQPKPAPKVVTFGIRFPLARALTLRALSDQRKGKCGFATVSETVSENPETVKKNCG